MKFGIFILPSWPEAEPSHQGRIYHEAVEQIQYAEELGFDAVWLAEHHFTRFGIISSAIPFATYVAARTKTIRIGTGVSVLTFHNPIFMAEETAMLDVLSNGRLDFGVGRGQVVYEYNNFKVEYDSRTQRFQEIVDIILGLWSTPGFTYHGTYYSVDDMTIAPVPVQRPHPPMYLAVSRTPGSVDVAISRNLPVLTSANTPDEDVLGIRSLYFERCAAVGKRPLVEDMPFFRLTHVAEDEKQASRNSQSQSDLGAGPEQPAPHADRGQRNLHGPGALAAHPDGAGADLRDRTEDHGLLRHPGATGAAPPLAPGGAPRAVFWGRHGLRQNAACGRDAVHGAVRA